MRLARARVKVRLRLIARSSYQLLESGRFLLKWMHCFYQQFSPKKSFELHCIRDLPTKLMQHIVDCSLLLVLLSRPQTQVYSGLNFDEFGQTVSLGGLFAVSKQ